MSLLFLGTYGVHKKPTLFGKGMMPIVATQVFKQFLPPATGKLSPKRGVPNFGKLWHFTRHNTTALSWLNEQGIEQTIFMNGLLPSTVALPTARAEFPEVMPSAIIFRAKRKVKSR